MIRNSTTSLSLGAVMVALFLSAMTPSAQAAWNVNDRTAQRHLEAIREYTETVHDYYLKHGQEGNAIAGRISGYNWPAGQQVPKVDEGFGLLISCGNDPSLTAVSIRSRLSQGFSVPDNASPEQVEQAQREICGAMRVLTNIRYNESVELVTVTLPAIKSLYETQVLRGVNDNGKRGFDNSGANQVSLQAAQLEFDMAITTYRERQAQYQQYIGLLSSYNDYLGRRVMGGRGGDGESNPLDRLVNSIVGGSIIQAALKLGN
ncbi:hypothetical protein H4O09_04680 [Stenotrophomonas sp. W1S232]|uniref:Uncharacterized protein n=1 Tax=Stenotrophomonas koreensis TaxID=266128 RepID=A0A7W3YUB0_9GAMM|nr:hypothetical protein [Stenotrophomonas koreensis]MBB1116360.1 hypothetical protein [Stenotrophomonas koreensis]